MSLLSIANAFALNVGIEQTDTVLLSPDRRWAEAAEMLDDAGDEIARRADWGQLTRSISIDTDPATLPDDFSRFTGGICAVHNGKPVRPLSRAEWAFLPAASGSPRYFLLSGNSITFWPSLVGTVTATYQSKVWRTNGETQWLSDTDETLLDDDLLELALITRWRRKQGMPFEDEEAEYEAVLQQRAKDNDRGRL